MTVRCDACDTENPVTSRFCSACGSQLGARCASCGVPVLRGSRFCSSCGAPVEVGEPLVRAPAPGDDEHGPATASASTEAGARAPATPIAERRQVSILFADLVDFTGFAEGRDPEEIRDLQARYFEASRTVILRYGGTIEKFIGDAVMAMWGAPIAHEDDAERAVRAGLELVTTTAALGGELGIAELAARAGIVSGEAAVTLGAVGQGMVAGDVVNTAARLQAAARSGTVLVDGATYRLVRDSVSFERAGEIYLRGKRLPVPAWEARHVVAMRGGGARSAMPEAPLVGRDSAFAIAKDLLHAVREERTVHLLSILGQAGVGKSRVVWELLKYVDGVVEKIYWHHARSPAYGEGLAYWALAEMVRRRAGIGEGERPLASRRKLSACLARYVPDAAERGWLTPHLAALLGLGQSPPAEREEAFAAWRTFFERVADQGTTVLVFDDLHWADQGLLDFIDHVAERSTGRPILLITAARPDLLDRRPGWGVGRRRVGLHLEALPRAAMAELLSGLAPGLPNEVSGRILDRAAGIPLYAVEILRMLVDRGDLEARGGTYHVRSSLDRLTVPETLQALIAARLDGLDREDREVLRDAAVLGQAFPLEAVAAVGSTTVEATEPRLQRLIRHELLVGEHKDRGAGQTRYRFTEWLVREVAYANLALRDRRARHLAAGRYYEALNDPELVGAVATHLLAAYRAGPKAPGSVGLAARSAAALRAAAERAFALHAPDQALEFIEGALSVTTDAAERAQLWEQAAISAQGAARLKEAEGYARQAIDWHTSRGDRSGVARTTVRLGGILALGYEAEASIAVVRAAVGDLEDDEALHDDPWFVELLAGLAHAYLLAGRTHEASEWADRALEGAGQLGLRPVLAGALATKGAALLEDGLTTEGIALLRASLGMAEEHGLIVPALRARNALSVGLLADDPRAALEAARGGLDVARRFGFRDLAIRLASNWAEAALDVGEWDGILELVTELDRADLPLVDRVDFESTAALVLTWRGDPTAAARFAALHELVAATEPDLAVASLRGREAAAALALGRPRDALTHADAATTLYRSTGMRTTIMWGTLPAARAALWAGDDARASRLIEEVESSGLHGRAVAATLVTLRAGLEARRGEVASASRHYAQAASEWRRLDVPLQLGFCQLEAARHLPPGSAGAGRAARAARSLLGTLGAAALVARLDSETGREPPPRRIRTRRVGHQSVEGASL